MSDPTPTHYNRCCPRCQLKLDPYRLSEIYGLNSMAHHIVKKGLCAGHRGHKDLEDDLKDIIKTASRWLEMIQEDQEYASNLVSSSDVIGENDILQDGDEGWDSKNQFWFPVPSELFGKKAKEYPFLIRRMKPQPACGFRVGARVRVSANVPIFQGESGEIYEIDPGSRRIHVNLHINLPAKSVWFHPDELELLPETEVKA